MQAKEVQMDRGVDIETMLEHLVQPIDMVNQRQPTTNEMANTCVV
jgi:hypothetical protein